MLISPSGFDGLSLLISASGNKPVVHGALTKNEPEHTKTTLERLSDVCEKMGQSKPSPTTLDYQRQGHAIKDGAGKETIKSAPGRENSRESQHQAERDTDKDRGG